MRCPQLIRPIPGQTASGFGGRQATGSAIQQMEHVLNALVMPNPTRFRWGCPRLMILWTIDHGSMERSHLGSPVRLVPRVFSIVRLTAGLHGLPLDRRPHGYRRPCPSRRPVPRGAIEPRSCKFLSWPPRGPLRSRTCTVTRVIRGEKRPRLNRILRSMYSWTASSSSMSLPRICIFMSWSPSRVSIPMVGIGKYFVNQVI